MAGDRKLEVQLLLEDKNAIRQLKKALDGIKTSSNSASTSFRQGWVDAAAKIYVARTAIVEFQRGLATLTGPMIQFESAFAGVRKTVNATEEEFSLLSAGLIELSKRIPVSTTELARIQELAGQLGVSGTYELTKFTETVAKIGITTNLTEEEAATSFARIANVMQEPISKVDRMGAAIVDLGNNFATTESEITEFTKRIAGAGKISGLTTPEILAIGTAMSSVGIQAEAGGTAVQKVLIALKKDGKEGAKAFQEFVDTLRQARDPIRVLEKMGLSNERTIRSFLSLANAGGLLKESIQTANKAYIENIALNEESAKRVATTQSKLIMAKSAAEQFAIALGNELQPAINYVLESFIDFGEKGEDVGLVLEIIATTALLSIEKIKASSWQGLKNFILFGPAGVGGAFGDDATNGIIQDLELQITELMERLSDTDSEDQKSVNDLFAPNPDLVQQKVDEALPIVQNGFSGLQNQALNFRDSFVDGFGAVETSMTSFVKNFGKEMGTATKSATADFSRTFTAVILGQQKADEAFKALGMRIISTFVEMGIQIVANQAIALAANAIIGSASFATANLIASAWAPAAALVSLATLGSNAGAAMGALGATTSFAHGLAATSRIAGLADGGTTLTGGTVLVGERGPELLDLPPAARVTPLDRVSSRGGGNVNVEIHIGTANFQDQESMRELALMVSEVLADETRSL